MKPCLPQNDSKPERRAQQLAEVAEHYNYDYDLLPPVAMAEKVPFHDQPTLKWVEDVTKTVVLSPSASSFILRA